MRAWVLMGLLLAPWALAKAPASGVPGVDARHLEARFWIERLPDAQRVTLAPDAIEALNARVERLDATVHDLDALPATFTRDEVLAWITPISSPPTRELFGEDGRVLDKPALDADVSNTALDTIAASTPARHGLVVRRAALRTFPTRRRVFSRADDRDIDRWQESALFPGTPVVVLHASRDGAWFFVASPRYAAWIERDAVALGPRETVLAYPRATPYLVVTGPRAETVYNPEEPGVSRVALDMGVRVPLLSDWPADRPVNGQHPYTAYVVQLPARDAQGALRLLPALLPRSSDVRTGFLDYTPANVIAQGFKFLGERYGWGHSYDARDCSGFVSEVYRSVGVQLPRNTRDQGTSEAFERIAFDEATPHAQRLQVIATLQAGDLVYIPGHVMMVLGHLDGTTYVIHDTTGIGWKDGQGRYVRTPLNQVAVTPLEPLMAGEDTPTVDTIYSIQRIRPRQETE